MFDRNPTYHFESDIYAEEHVLLETRVVDLSTVTISQGEGGLLVVTRNVEAAEVADDDETPVPQRQPKYRLEPEGDMFRIVALRDIAKFYVDAGGQGGLVSSPHILAQTGDCWIGYGSKATSDSRVHGDALVHGDSVLTGYVRVEGDARVGDSRLDGSINIGGNAALSQCTFTSERHSHLHVHGTASFCRSQITVTGQQVLHISGGCVAGAYIRNRFELVSFFTGSRFGWLDVFRGVNGDQRFSIGCQDHGSPDGIRDLARDYSITDVETAMLEGFLALADAARGGWLPEPAATKSGAAPDVAVLSQYGEDLSRDTTF